MNLTYQGDMMKTYFYKTTIYCSFMLVLFLSLTPNCLAAEQEASMFQHGVELFQDGKYEAAIDVFKQITKKNPDNGSAHFFIGLALQGKEEFSKSIASFQKAGDLDPEYKQLSMYQIGLAYLQMNNKSTAMSFLQQAIDYDSSTDAATNARELLASLPPGERPSKKWQLKLGTGLEFDDNLTVEEQDNVSGQEDYAVVFELEGKYSPEFLSPYSGEVYYEFYQSFYEDFSEFDLQTHTAGLTGEQEFQGWDIGLDYNFTYMFLGSDGFLQTHSLSPSVGKSLQSNLYTNFSYIFIDKDFRNDSDSDRDAFNNSIGGDAFYFFQKNQAYCQLGYRLEDEDASGDEFDYMGHIFNAAVQIPAPLDTKVRLSYKYHFKDYSNITQSIGSEREDKKQTVSLTVSGDIRDNIGLKFDYQYIDNDSNLSSNEYNQNIVFLGATVVF